MRGDIRTALDLIGEQYAAGADPAVVLEDMLELTHWLTRIKITPAAADALGVPEAERMRGRELAEGLGMAELARAWQMLLKGLGETRNAPVPIQAAEMALVRLGYAARLPTPAEAIKAWTAEGGHANEGVDQGTDEEVGMAVHREGGEGAKQSRQGPLMQGSGPLSSHASPPFSTAPQASHPGAAYGASTQGSLAAAVVDDPAAGEMEDLGDPQSFEAVVALVGAQREGLLQAKLMSAVHLVHFEPGRIEMRLTETAPDDLPRQLSRFLNEHTRRRWLVTVSRMEGEATLLEQREAADAKQLARAADHPVVRAVLDVFPGASIVAVRDLAAPLEQVADGEAEDES
jgi:DNA polymerase-3 subunit gamma/tau